MALTLNIFCDLTVSPAQLEPFFAHDVNLVHRIFVKEASAFRFDVQKACKRSLLVASDAVLDVAIFGGDHVNYVIDLVLDWVIYTT